VDFEPLSREQLREIVDLQVARLMPARPIAGSRSR
jgi:hypothetical protein